MQYNCTVNLQFNAKGGVFYMNMNISLTNNTLPWNRTWIVDYHAVGWVRLHTP